MSYHDFASGTLEQIKSPKLWWGKKRKTGVALDEISIFVFLPEALSNLCVRWGVQKMLVLLVKSSEFQANFWNFKVIPERN